MPHHVGASVNIIEEFEGRSLVSSVDEMKTHFSVVKEQLLKNNLFPGWQSDCELCLSNPHMREKLKCGIQQLMKQGIILVEQVLSGENMATHEIPYYQNQIPIPQNLVNPLVIIVPSPFLFKST